METAAFGIDYARDDDGMIIGEQIGESVLTSNMTDEYYTDTVRRVIDDEIIDGGE